jgi:hypothetical protein
VIPNELLAMTVPLRGRNPNEHATSQASFGQRILSELSMIEMHLAVEGARSIQEVVAYQTFLTGLLNDHIVGGERQDASLPLATM